jgi:cytidine deaminase
MDRELLIRKAIEAREHAYAPYSNFKVGAVLVGPQGQWFAGCNIENVAFSPTNCAERTAIYRAISDGYEPRSFQALVVIADTAQPITPCGVCRQVLLELCSPDMVVICSNLTGDYLETTVSALLPHAFVTYDRIDADRK